MVLAAVKIAFLAGLALTGTEPDQAIADAPLAAPGMSLVAARAVPTAREPSAVTEPATPVSPNSAPLPTAALSLQAAEKASSPATATVPATSPSAAANVTSTASAAVDGDPLQSALAQASSRSALSVPRLLGASVAQAADLPPLPEVAAPAPNVRPLASPVAPDRVVRPDEITPQAPPAPTVSPFVSPDSAARKQAELNRREQELLALQQQMEARMTELHGLENRLQGMLQDANTTQDSKFAQLVDMYANMKPRQAAQALTSMDETIAVKILTGMKSKQSGEILSYMDPTHAARLSEVMSKMQM